jgi:FMN-dependent dehydrogenase
VKEVVETRLEPPSLLLAPDRPTDPRALAAGGQAGVERALAIVREEFEIALALLGSPTPADVTRSHVLAPVS